MVICCVMILDDSAGRYTGSYRIPLFIFLMIWIFKNRNTGICCNVRNATVGRRREEYFLFVTYTLIQNITSSEICALHLTHLSVHTPGAEGSQCWCPGTSWGFGALLKGLTSVVDNSCRSGDSNPQPRVTSPTLYPLEQRFSIPVLKPPRSAYFACLSLLTHLIQIISLLEVRFMHELCSDWHAPYTGSIAPYSLSRGNPLKFTSFRNIQSWICAAQRLHARMSETSCTSVNIYNFNSRLAHFNALWMEYIRSLRTGIMAEYPVMSTSQGTCVRIEQTSEAIRVTYEICRAGGREDWNWELLH